MAYLIGTDEAGYGPNLGPLLVSASVWQVGDVDCELYRELESVVTSEKQHREKTEASKFAIADSKMLYKPRGGLAGLELPLFSTVQELSADATWRDCWRSLTDGNCDEIDQLPWYRDFDCSLPIDANLNEVAKCRESFASCMSTHAIELVTLRSVAVFPQRFNQLVDECDSKGAALSNVTLDLVADLIRELDSDPICVVCDKHGGRNSYAGFLQPRFDDRLVRVCHESRPESSYYIGTPKQPIAISFRSKGESFLPSALASIASKYLRELAMLAFNEFWLKRQPDLRPTAGYPMDAKRFRLDVAETKRRLAIHDDEFWRNR